MNVLTRINGPKQLSDMRIRLAVFKSLDQKRKKILKNEFYDMVELSLSQSLYLLDKNNKKQFIGKNPTSQL